MAKSYEYMKTDCAQCGARCWKSPEVPAGGFMCRRCRSEFLRGGRTLERVCEQCGGTFTVSRPGKTQRFCSKACVPPPPPWNKGRRRSPTASRAVPSQWNQRTRRQTREAVTPGLSYWMKRRLRERLVAAGATCFYCSSAATTMDHVIPLSRGGTGHEGNLVPCCRRCNASKSDLLIVEWRFGKPHGGTFMQQPWMTLVQAPKRTPKPPKLKPRPRHADCPICGSCFTTLAPMKMTCSPECSRELTGRRSRDHYRLANGIPVDPSEPTAYWRNLCSERVTAAASPTKPSDLRRSSARASAEPTQLELVSVDSLCA